MQLENFLAHTIHNQEIRTIREAITNALQVCYVESGDNEGEEYKLIHWSHMVFFFVPFISDTLFRSRIKYLSTKQKR